MQKLNLSVNGMHCQSCVTLLTKGIQKDPGVKNVNVNYATEKATVEFDETKTSQDKIIKIISGLGYSARPVTGEINPEYENQKKQAEIKKPELKQQPAQTVPEPPKTITTQIQEESPKN